MQWWWNDYVLKATRDAEDFIGFNYYFHHLTRFGFLKHAGEKKSDLGWGLSPKGFYNALIEVKKYGLPIYVTEHGLADSKDVHRKWYITESLKYLKKAMDEGVDVRGYLHWSLLDNFEWAEGYWPRFGLIEVDYKTLKRKARSSAYVLKGVIEEGLSL